MSHHLAYVLVFTGAVLGISGIVLGIYCMRRKPDAKPLIFAGAILTLSGIVCAGLVASGLLEKEAKPETAGEAFSIYAWEEGPAPNLTLTTLAGETLSLHDLKGRRVLLHFWNSYDRPSSRMLPDLRRLAAAIPPEELLIIAVSQEEAESLRPFVEEKELGYPVVSATVTIPPYNRVEILPTSFMIDRNGILQFVILGYKEEFLLNRIVRAPDFDGKVKTPPKVKSGGIEE